MNKLEHFLLPEQSNNLYTKEAISSISLTRDVAKKINELVDAYNELSSLDLEWKQEQEGTIRKAIVYIKDNLLNTLHDLVELYEKEGFFSLYVKKYTKELEKRIDNLLEAGTVDGELIDIRFGANNFTFKTAGDSVRTQIKSIIEYLSGFNLLKDIAFYNGFFSVDENGEEYSLLSSGGKIRDYHEVTTDFFPVVAGEYYTASVFINDNPLTTDNIWLCVHSYDSNKNFLRREFAIESEQNELSNVYQPEKDVSFIRVMARTFHTARVKLEKGIFATSDKYAEGNLLNNFPLVMDGCYTYNVDEPSILFVSAGTNLEKSTIGIDCRGKKELSVYAQDSGSMWVSFNFLDENRIFVTDSVANRTVINSSGKHTVTIPENACTMFISARTLTLTELAVFFKDDLISLDEKHYKSLYENKALLNDSLSQIESTPPIKAYQIRDIAHRGYSWSAPENTLSAYKLAYEKGFKFVECDIGFTSDNIPVLLHDYTIDRTSNGTGTLSELTFEYVRSLDFGSWLSQDYVGTQIPTFEEFINLCRKLCLYPYIEVKEIATNEQLDILINTVKMYGMINNVTWISFGLNQLSYIKSKLPAARLGYNVTTPTTISVDNTATLKSGANSVFLNLFNYDDDLINYAITSNIPVERWGINSEETILSQNVYISGLTSDYVLASEVLKNSEV